MHDDPFPVEWTGRQAIVAFPARVDVSNADQLRDRLLSVINRGAAVLVADLTGTVSCDHAAVTALARACQRGAVSGTQVRLVVTAPVVRRVLSLEGLDRVVSIYPSLEAATAAGTSWAVAAGRPVSAGKPVPYSGGAPRLTPAVLWQLIDALGDGLALIAHDGTIALVNRRCAEMFGYQREELTGLPVEISLSPMPTASEVFVLAVIRDTTDSGPQNDLVDLARDAVAGQSQATSDLFDQVVNRLFQVGLSLQAAAGLPGDVARKRLAEALDQLDEVIHQVRNYAFTSGGDPSGNCSDRGNEHD